jgi:hypothetical protein
MLRLLAACATAFADEPACLPLFAKIVPQKSARCGAPAAQAHARRFVAARAGYARALR